MDNQFRRKPCILTLRVCRPEYLLKMKPCTFKMAAAQQPCSPFKMAPPSELSELPEPCAFNHVVGQIAVQPCIRLSH